MTLLMCWKNRYLLLRNFISCFWNLLFLETCHLYIYHTFFSNAKTCDLLLVLVVNQDPSNMQVYINHVPNPLAECAAIFYHWIHRWISFFITSSFPSSGQRSTTIPDKISKVRNEVINIKRLSCISITSRGSSHSVQSKSH